MRPYRLLAASDLHLDRIIDADEVLHLGEQTGADKDLATTSLGLHKRTLFSPLSSVSLTGRERRHMATIEQRTGKDGQLVYRVKVWRKGQQAHKEWNWLDDSPMRKVRKPKEPGPRMRFLSDDERTR